MGLRENNVPALLLNFHRLGPYHAFITHLLPGVPGTGEGTCWHTRGWLGTRGGGKAQGQNLFLSNSLVQWYSLGTKGLTHTGSCHSVSEARMGGS